MLFSELMFPTYTQMLTALSRWLDKACDQAETPDALMAARLAEDMFPLAAQIRFTCLQAYEGVTRLQGAPLGEVCAVLAQEGRAASDHPGTLDQAQLHITTCLEFLQAQDPAIINGDDARPITLELPNGMVFDMRADQYVRDWALPQFNFHLITAYAILRAQGVDLGKADYIQHALAYLRPGTAPTAG